MRQPNDRNFGKLQQLGCRMSGMTSKDLVMLVNENWIGKAESPDVFR
jgi:hypothetical protein